MSVRAAQEQLQITILHRKDDTWLPQEVGKLVNGLMTEASEHPQHPEYVLLYGHYTKERTLTVLGGAKAYTTVQVVGLRNEQLPFRPTFA